MRVKALLALVAGVFTLAGDRNAVVAGVMFTVPLAVPAFAQSPSPWPQRPVKFIVSLGPGSGADISARLIAERLTTRWNQPVVVENRPGGDAVVAIKICQGEGLSVAEEPFLFRRLGAPCCRCSADITCHCCQNRYLDQRYVLQQQAALPH